MKRLLLQSLAMGILAFGLMGMSTTAHADDDDDWNRRHRHTNDYWDNHWNWYKQRYRPHYNRSFQQRRYVPPYGHYYGRPYYSERYYYNPYDDRRDYRRYRDRDWGGLRLGPLQLRWN